MRISGFIWSGTGGALLAGLVGLGLAGCSGGGDAPAATPPATTTASNGMPSAGTMPGSGMPGSGMQGSGMPGSSMAGGGSSAMQAGPGAGAGLGRPGAGKGVLVAAAAPPHHRGDPFSPWWDTTPKPTPVMDLVAPDRIAMGGTGAAELQPGIEVHEVPTRRVAGIYTGNGVYALLDGGPGNQQVVRPGDMVDDYRVAAINPDSVTLKKTVKFGASTQTFTQDVPLTDVLPGQAPGAAIGPQQPGMGLGPGLGPGLGQNPGLPRRGGGKFGGMMQ